MGMHEGRARLGKTMKELLAHWAETRTQWRDNQSAAFETKYLVPMEMDLRQAISAMDLMSQAIQQIQRDCNE